MTAYAIAFGPRSNRRYLTPAPPAGPNPKGWRPIVWTADRSRADLFSSDSAARKWAADNLRHDVFDVVVVPPTISPPTTTGGTPAAIAA